MRSLGPDEKALWDQVTASIRPLSRNPGTAPSAQTTQKASPIPSATTPAPRPAQTRPHARRPSPPPATGAGLDGSWDRKLKGGAVRPDRTVDLHGHDLDRAWRAIDQALDLAIAAGDRVVLLITGHERRGEPPVERGRIRAAVHGWLAASRHSSRIAAVRGAHPRHGGGGSLYIVLRRNPPRSTLS